MIAGTQRYKLIIFIYIYLLANIQEERCLSTAYSLIFKYLASWVWGTFLKGFLKGFLGKMLLMEL